MCFFKINPKYSNNLLSRNFDLLLNHIHIWCIKLDQLAFHQQLIQSFLSPDEHEKSQKYVFSEDRNQYILSRGALRYFLGKYLSIPPVEIKFSYSGYGKPEICNFQNKKNIRFNVSHGGQYFLLAICLEKNIGIDVENIKNRSDFMKIARLFFSENEYHFLSAALSIDRPKLFFELWTKKEALIKCLGTGLSHPLHEIDMCAQERFLVKNQTYQVASLTLDSKHQAALSYQGELKHNQIFCFSEWPD